VASVSGMRMLLAVALGLSAACGGTTSSTAPALAPVDHGRFASEHDAALFARVKASTIELPAGDSEWPCEGYPTMGIVTLGQMLGEWEVRSNEAIQISCEGRKCKITLYWSEDECESGPPCEGAQWDLTLSFDDAGEIDPRSLTCMEAG